MLSESQVAKNIKQSSAKPTSTNLKSSILIFKSSTLMPQRFYPNFPHKSNTFSLKFINQKSSKSCYPVQKNQCNQRSKNLCVLCVLCVSKKPYKSRVNPCQKIFVSLCLHGYNFVFRISWSVFRSWDCFTSFAMTGREAARQKRQIPNEVSLGGNFQIKFVIKIVVFSKQIW